ncbi:hypothetical protein Noda2021_03600 [Candidatus Dependentiae bacterium Noda2021]|nr:hypothetical protein Noda2021_03600 [Candidatus Dependentiae bacterium Noda2021]
MLLMLPLIILGLSNQICAMQRLVTMPQAHIIETNLRDRFHDYYIDQAHLHTTLGSKPVLLTELLNLLEEHVIRYHESTQQPYFKEFLKGGVFELAKSIFSHDPIMSERIKLMKKQHFTNVALN